MPLDYQSVHFFKRLTGTSSHEMVMCFHGRLYLWRQLVLACKSVGCLQLAGGVRDEVVCFKEN
jgi:hypothetical protein